MVFLQSIHVRFRFIMIFAWWFLLWWRLNPSYYCFIWRWLFINYVDPYDVVFAGGHSGALGDAYGDAFANGRGGALGVTSTCTPKCTCASEHGVYDGFVGVGYCERYLPVVKWSFRCSGLVWISFCPLSVTTQLINRITQSPPNINPDTKEPIKIKNKKL